MRQILTALLLTLGLASPALAAVCPPTPALPDNERRTEYAGIVAQAGPFNVGFQLYGDNTDYGNWLEVWVSGVKKTAVTDYTVTSPTGPLANLCRPISDAQVTFTAAQTGTIEILGARRPRRTSQVSENAGVTARAFNQVVSDMEAQVRERWDFAGRLLRTAPGDSLTGVLPPAATRANGFLKFDSSGLIPQIIAGGPGSGTVQGPLTTTVGDMAIWNINNGTLLADAPLNWAPLGGASGNGSFNFTSPGGIALTSTDTTTLGNSVQLGGTLRNGDTIALTLNYNNAAGTARSVTISYGPITGADTLTTIAAGLATALQTAGLSAPLSTDFAPFRFFIPGTVGNVGSLFKFNFAWLTGNNGTPTLQVVNASTVATPTTISMNGTTLAVGAGVTNAIATWDQVNGISALRNYTGGRGGLANDALFYLIVGSNSSNPATQLQYANIGFAIGDPTPATPYGVIQLATGNSWSGQANVWIGKGVFISNFGNNLTPTYPGAVASQRTAAADPGTGSLSMQGWTIPGNAITGTWPANPSFGFWGNSNLTHTDATKVAIAQDTGGFTFANSAAGQPLDLRIGNLTTFRLSYAGLATPTIVTLGIAGTSAGQYCLANATSGSLCVQPGTGALGSNVLTLPVATDTLAAIAAAQVLTNKTISGASNTLSNIGNASLTNSSLTIAGHSVSLGGTQTLAASDLTNGVTGSGAVALAASPTFTGTLGAAAINATGTITAASTINANSASGVYQINGTSVLSLSSGNILIQDSAGASAWVATTSDNFFDAGTSHFRTKAGTEYAAITTASAAFANGTAIPAGGTAGTGIKVSSTSNFGVFFGSGVPTLSAAKGSLYLRSDGAINARLYINTDGSTTWTAFNTASWLLWRDIDPAANDNSPAFLEKVA